MLERFSADSLELLLIDPTVDAMKVYENLPHLAAPVLTHPVNAVEALQAVVVEMERRYEIFAHERVRNIDDFNARSRDKASKSVKVVEQQELKPDGALDIPIKMARLVIIISELSDLMIMKPNDTECLIARLTQMSRSAGIHCIVSTQRASGKVLTGLIKANIPARIAFQVAAWRDSKVILGVAGAEKLKGKGDMLYLAKDAATPFSAQGAIVSDEDLLSRVAAAVKQGRSENEPRMLATLEKEEVEVVNWRELEGVTDIGSEFIDEVTDQVVALILQEGKASIALLQRRFNLTYIRATRLMDQMEMMGIVGPKNGTAPRKALVAAAENRGRPKFEARILAPPKEVISVKDDAAELLDLAIAITLEARRVSVFFLQRRLRLGYKRAVWVLDEMEKKGIVGPSNGAKPREILVEPDASPS